MLNKKPLQITDHDKYYFHEGKHIQAYRFMGAHFSHENNQDGVRFTTWAPNAKSICVIGDFSDWHVRDENYMHAISTAGMWSVFIPHATNHQKYKFVVRGKDNHYVYKSDPYARASELRPNTASVINFDNQYHWQDQKWLEQRCYTDHYKTPINIYELHLGSWKTENDHFLDYERLCDFLPEYVQYMNYTHVELMPLHEHPLDASWGYQPTGFYSVNSRHGNLVGLKKLIDKLHQANIGVILDWVPGHFCKDEHGLINFDGSRCYEYQNNTKATNKGWGTNNFDLGRYEVKSFLISNALYWINEFHIDGLRVDAVSNILYLNYDRKDGEWEPNINGGHENLEGISFLQELNSVIKHNHKGVMTIAEESSAWPNITTPVAYGGLGFDYKWNMGWMNDTLRYIALDPVHRKYHHNLINFSMAYHYSEKFILPISHDEVVHGKKSLINKMPGDLWSKYAGLRLYMTYMIAHPGKKLSFMGNEFGQFVEWREYEQLQWHIIEKYDSHGKTLEFFKQLNAFYKSNPELWQCDYEYSGFRWIDADNADQSILSFARFNKHGDALIFAFNFTPVVYHNYDLGVPKPGCYSEIFNSDSQEFGGSGQIHYDKILSSPRYSHGFESTVTIKIPPMAAIVLKCFD